jgi:hypothetical protein
VLRGSHKGIRKERRDAIEGVVFSGRQPGLRMRAARRGTTESLGHVHFRLGTFGAFLDDSTTVGDELRATTYATAALPPASPWLGSASPAKPLLAPPDDEILQQNGSGDDASVRLLDARAAFIAVPGDTVPVRWWLVQTLGSNYRWTQRLVAASGPALSLFARDTLDAQWVAVTPISRTGVAGRASMWRVAR